MSTDKNPTTIDPAALQDLLAAAVDETIHAKDKPARKLRKGDRFSAVVHKIGESMAFMDLGNKLEGMMDLADHRAPDSSLTITEGQEMEVIVIDVATNGLFVRKTLNSMAETAAQLMAAKEVGLPVHAKVVGVNKGGLDLELFDVRAFCPSSQVDVQKNDDLTGFVGQTLSFRIMDLTKDGRQIVLSRRALLQEEYDQKLATMKAKFVEGAIVEGKVVRLQPFGAFIDLGGVEGMCHVSEITHDHIFNPSQKLAVDQVVRVKITKIETVADKTGKHQERYTLSMKSLESDPWSTVASKYVVGNRYPGKVVRLQQFGAFVELEAGIDGMVHISEISSARIEHPKDALTVGQEVSVRVLAVESDKKRVSLAIKDPAPPKPEKTEPAPRPARAPRTAPISVKPAGEERPARRPRTEKPVRDPISAPTTPAEPAVHRFAVGQVYDATVDRVEPFGVFVTLPHGGRALVPNSELGVVKNADQKTDFKKVFAAGSVLRVALTQRDNKDKELWKASKNEAVKADERVLVKEWESTQKKSSGAGFGTFAALFQKK